MWPLLLRPEPRFWLSTSAATGGPLCSPGLTTLTSERRPFDVGLTLTSGMTLRLRREVDFLARLQAHVGLLPVAPPAHVGAEALLLALDVRDLHRLDLDLEHELDRGLDLGLRRVLQHAEHRLLVLVGDERALFGHDRREQHRHQPLVAVFLRRAHAASLYPIRSSNCVTAPFVSSTWLKRTRLTGSTSRVSSTSTFGRFRDDRNTFSSSFSVTTSTGPATP